jgi:DNA-binding NarL/FixJ family response regulator
VRIVIGEDSALFREGMTRLLTESGHEVVAKVGDATALIDAVHTHAPDAVVIDVRMPPDLTDDGARAAKQLRAANPTLPMVLLSQHVETKNCVELASSGYFGYLLKDRVIEIDQFLETLDVISRGGSVLDPLVVSQLLSPGDVYDPVKQLSEREFDVLSYMAQGRTNLGISRVLHLSERTVESHVTRIIHKLGIHVAAEDNRRVLAVLAYLQSRHGEPDRHP